MTERGQDQTDKEMERVILVYLWLHNRRCTTVALPVKSLFYASRTVY